MARDFIILGFNIENKDITPIIILNNINNLLSDTNVRISKTRSDEYYKAIRGRSEVETILKLGEHLSDKESNRLKNVIKYYDSLIDDFNSNPNTLYEYSIDIENIQLVQKKFVTIIYSMYGTYYGSSKYPNYDIIDNYIEFVDYVGLISKVCNLTIQYIVQVNFNQLVLNTHINGMFASSEDIKFEDILSNYLIGSKK